MIRVLHTADWHLGHELHGFDRGPEHDAFLAWLLTTLAAERVDLLIVAGDVYHGTNPPIAAQQRLYRFLSSALAANGGLRIVLTGGNHDSAARVELPRDLLDASRVKIVGSMPRRDGAPDHAACLMIVPDCACVLAIPYLRPGDLDEAGLAAFHAAALDATAAARGGLPLILTGHLTVAGGALSDRSERRVIVGGEEATTPAAFPAGCAYIALGHLHRAQRIAASSPMRYAGSPLPLSLAERGYRHSVVIAEIEADGTLGERLMETPRSVAFLRIPERGAATIEDVLAEIAALPHAPGEGGDPYLEIAVALDRPEPDLRRRIDAALAGKRIRLARIERVASGGHAPDAVGAGLDEVTPESVFIRRHETAHAAPPTPPLLEAFRELLAGVET